MSAGQVTDITSFLVDGSRWGWLIVRVEADAGVYGPGEGSLEGREQSVQAVVGELKRYLVGQDPTHVEQHDEVLYRQAVWTGGAVLQSAISAVEMAYMSQSRVPLSYPWGGDLGSRRVGGTAPGSGTASAHYADQSEVLGTGYCHAAPDLG
jgi:galactonate dehydratase